jgi:hypothetical protein
MKALAKDGVNDDAYGVLGAGHLMPGVTMEVWTSA